MFQFRALMVNPKSKTRGYQSELTSKLMFFELDIILFCTLADWELVWKGQKASLSDLGNLKWLDVFLHVLALCDFVYLDGMPNYVEFWIHTFKDCSNILENSRFILLPFHMGCPSTFRHIYCSQIDFIINTLSPHIP